MDNDIQFDNQWRPQQLVLKRGWGEKLAEALVKYSGGLVKDKKQANYVILAIVGVIFVISFIIFLNTFGKEKIEERIIPAEITAEI